MSWDPKNRHHWKNELDFFSLERYNVLYWILVFFRGETCGWHAEVPILAHTEAWDTADRIDGHLFVLGHKDIDWESAKRDGKRLGHAGWMRVRPGVQNEYIVGGGWTHFYSEMHPTWSGRVWRWGHLLWQFFGGKIMIKPVKSGQTHQNP